MTTFDTPAISPAYLGVGYIIGPRLAALNFAGGVVALAGTPAPHATVPGPLAAEALPIDPLAAGARSV
ncbi:MAG: hypothetical protein AzoDbin1_05274 [Azoarcus sp.]|nr:hypothetical protein [Azoarcus sp.]